MISTRFQACQEDAIATAQDAYKVANKPVTVEIAEAVTGCWTE